MLGFTPCSTYHGSCSSTPDGFASGAPPPASPESPTLGWTCHQTDQVSEIGATESTPRAVCSALFWPFRCYSNLWTTSFLDSTVISGELAYGERRVVIFSPVKSSAVSKKSAIALSTVRKFLSMDGVATSSRILPIPMLERGVPDKYRARVLAIRSIQYLHPYSRDADARAADGRADNRC